MTSHTPLHHRTYSFNGVDTLELYIFIDDENVFWFKADDIAIFMGKSSSISDGVLTIVWDKNKLPWSVLLLLLAPAFRDISGHWKSDEIFINETGLHQLLSKSSMNVDHFIDWLGSLLPNIRNTKILQFVVERDCERERAFTERRRFARLYEAAVYKSNE